MKLMNIFLILITINLAVANLNVVNQESSPQNTQLPSSGVAVDEVVVESSLFIKSKHQPQLRRVRRSILGNFNILKSLTEHKRVKRQIDEYGQSQSSANAAAHQNYNNLYGFGNSAANAQAQAFNSQGSTGSFGASAAGTITQSVDGNRLRIQNSAGASHALTFNLPNGQSINFASTNSFANGPVGNNADSRGSAVSVNRI